MKQTRWMDMVKRSKIDQEPMVETVNIMVAKLLARQHRAFVRMVKKFEETYESAECQMACRDILAALAKQKVKK